MAIMENERQIVHEQLCEWIESDTRRLKILAELMIAIPLSRSLQAPDLAANIVRDVQDVSIGQMLRRFYKNEAVTWETHYLPLLKQVYAKLELPVYYLLMDTTDVGSDHRALVLSLAYHNRSLPLIWQIEPGSKGHTKEDDQAALIRRLGKHFKPAGPVIFLGDAEFVGVTVMETLDDLTWYYVCRTAPHLYIHADHDSDGTRLGDLVPQAGAPTQQLDDISFTTKHRHGPVGAYACWEEPHDEPLLLIYHLPPGFAPRDTYKHRFWTEPLFADCKEGGFRLNTSRLKHADRLGRLFLAAAAAYLWMVALGAAIILDQLADWVDRPNRRTLSIFKTGWRWFMRQIKLQRLVVLDFTFPNDLVLPALKFY